MTDEPLLDSNAPRQPGGGERHGSLADRIGQLLHAQQYAILCTQGQGQPYGSLVAFAATPDLRSVVFATPVSTRKYRLLQACDHVALVFDSRSTSSDDMMNIEAVTATGRAAQIAGGTELEDWAGLLVRRHRQLDTFIQSPTTALFRVDIIRYLHVTHFQEVRQWIPTVG
jgi:hypothetical protein